MTDDVEATLPDQWQQWFDDHSWKLLAFARQTVGTVSDTEDVVQEVILEFWKKDPDEPPDLPLVLHKLRQRAIDFSRRRQSQLRRETRWQLAQTDSALCSAARQADAAALTQSNEVQALVSRLEPIFREVVVLKLWSGLTMQQIARVLSVSPNTVSSRYRLALQKLRGFLKEARHER